MRILGTVAGLVAGLLGGLSLLGHRAAPPGGSASRPQPALDQNLPARWQTATFALG